MRIQQQEYKHLLTAWALLSIAFAIALRQPQLSILQNLAVAGASAGLGLIAHELAHKYVAQHYNKFAEFKASISSLLVSIAVAFSGVVLAAPGAVHISGFVNQKQRGLIAAAGPATNAALALITLPLFLLTTPNTLLQILLATTFLVNAWFALFNLAPFWVFDGAKIIEYNKLLYTALTLTSVLLVFIGAVFVAPTL